ncbi:MAG: C-GCAxxG-C-C family (seleno)protein [Deferribacterales bacterium]
MSETLADLTARDAVSYFKEGYACSEAVLLAFEKNTEINFSDEIKRGMSAFVEGIGGSGCICGALSGSVFVLSSMGGRLKPDEPTDKLNKAVRKLHDAFREEFKSACCRVITKNASKFLGIGKFNSCHKTVDFCARQIISISIENGWIKG